eukprot:CAMPEP_0174941908 /NCGR_PEP_ID=MMETSP1355-20121228/72950_1 /TAXON_ID=464990 /ORGANISM="Hemiselmis tepida, Strain CCMP443" /LENGTH=78 /DNA_ID=CAMNT_0016189051 /DNA_START=122 /DNA_END=355 /DNA_ORIENTATION=-
MSSGQSPAALGHPNADIEAGEGEETPQPFTVRVVEGAKRVVNDAIAVIGDYISLYTGLLPWSTSEALTKEEYCKTLPL